LIIPATEGVSLAVKKQKLSQKEENQECYVIHANQEKGDDVYHRGSQNQASVG
jgi:hypothetical protein